MSITLNVKPYCSDCGEFNPIADIINITTYEDIMKNEKKYMTNVYCQHGDRCREIYESMVRKVKEGEVK